MPLGTDARAPKRAAPAAAARTIFPPETAMTSCLHSDRIVHRDTLYGRRKDVQVSRHFLLSFLHNIEQNAGDSRWSLPRFSAEISCQFPRYPNGWAKQAALQRSLGALQRLYIYIRLWYTYIYSTVHCMSGVSFLTSLCLLILLRLVGLSSIQRKSFILSSFIYSIPRNW